MNDWQTFVEAVPWFLATESDVKISKSQDGFDLPSSVVNVFPALAHLLAQSFVTNVEINNVQHYLHGFSARSGERFGWLCLESEAYDSKDTHPDHNLLLSAFGGIIERFNEPENTWLLNLNDALTAREASQDAGFIRDYMWAFDEAGVALPIDPTDYYSIAREANGNTTLCHRTTGKVILFAPDHSFDFVIPLSNCPEYTLYEIKGIATFRDWVESVAKQWLANVNL